MPAEARTAHYGRMLSDVLEALGRSTGPDFLDRLLAALARALGADVAFVGRLDARGRTVETLALWNGTENPAPIRFALPDSPCAAVVAQEVAVFESGTAALFPRDALIRDLGIEAFGGASLFDRSGQVLGLLVVLSRAPFAEPGLVGPILSVFGARAAAEIESAEAQGRLANVNHALRLALDARAASEARLQDFARASSDWFWEQDAALRFTYVSEGLRLVTGIDPALIIGKTREELRVEGIFERSDGSWRGLSETVAARAAFRDFDYAQRGPDGRLLHLRISGLPILDETGRFCGYRGTGRDVTALYEARAEAARNAQRLQDGIEAMPAGFALFDAEDRLVLHNGLYRDLLSTGSFVPPPTGEPFDELVRRSVRRGEHGAFEDEAGFEALVAARIAHHQAATGQPWEQALPDGRWHEVRERRTAEGGVVLIRSDVTDRKRSEQRLRDAIESLPVGFLMLDAEARFVMCNRRYREFFPDAGGVLEPGRSFAEIAVAAMPAERPEMIAHVLERQRQATGEPATYRTPAGRHLMITHTRSAEGSTLGVHVDITDMVRLQQELTTATRRAEEALAVRTRFLANMSHELRTPLNAVIGFSELMMMETQGPLDARYLDFARIIKQSGEFLLSLIVDILDIARIEAGKMSVGQEPVALAGIVREVAAMLSLQAERKGLRLTLALPPGDTVVPGDPRRLKQVVQNLMSNAVKFTETGEVSVSLERKGAAVRLCVADTGRGMSAEDIAFAMEPFQQRRGMDSREVMEGTGLGLPLVKALVDLHGGRFELRSEPGRGTDATVWLPAVAAGGAVV